jgi:hypothetical protein
MSPLSTTPLPPLLRGMGQGGCIKRNKRKKVKKKGEYLANSTTNQIESIIWWVM